MEHSLLNSKEKREYGIVTKIFDVNLSSNGSSSLAQQQLKYGSIKSIGREDLIYFSLNEIIKFQKQQPTIQLNADDCVEFCVVDCHKVRVFVVVVDFLEIINYKLFLGFNL